MIITRYFVYIHTSRTAGTFLNKLILEHVPGAHMIQYHGHLKDLPEEFSDLPVIGFVRNPWDWYVSMFCDYRRKQQYVYQIVSDRDTVGFKETIFRFFRLSDNSNQSKRLLDQLRKAAPTAINARTPGRRHLPGLRSEHFASATGAWSFTPRWSNPVLFPFGPGEISLAPQLIWLAAPRVFYAPAGPGPTPTGATDAGRLGWRPVWEIEPSKSCWPRSIPP